MKSIIWVLMLVSLETSEKAEMGVDFDSKTSCYAEREKVMAEPDFVRMTKEHGQVMLVCTPKGTMQDDWTKPF